MSLDHQAFPDSTSLDSVASVNQLEQDRALCVGAKYESYYQAQFEKITTKKQYAGFNIAAFFLGVVWLFYRKMYSYGFMALWLYGFMALWLYGFMALWLYGHWFNCGHRDG